ncbi:MAG: SDR family NAD(P)-dependent oxidoreductase [bacterium]|nr:SDR family NAD(P)-dependent oxidoreductase [bacterium]
MTQNIVMIGAAGGLGAAIAKDYAAEGARLVLVGRNRDALLELAQEIGGQTQVFTADLTNAASLAALHEDCQRYFGTIDLVVNAAGVDVRKDFLSHSLEDIERSLQVNLLGAILLTRAFLPGMLAAKKGQIIHLGGFADGRLAFPFYSVDVATRAGLRSFIESVNREIEGSGVVLTYFCPAAADTPVERPYHALWREMGITIASPEAVAATVVRASRHRRPLHIMGIGAQLLAAINAICPGIADWLVLRRYRTLMARHLAQ